MRKRVVMSKKEVVLIILTLVGTIALMAWQTYRVAKHHMGASSIEQNAPTKISQSQ